MILGACATSADPLFRHGPSVHPRAEHDAAAQHGAGARAAPHGGAANKQRASWSFLAYLGLQRVGMAILGASRACTSHFRGTCLREVCRGSWDDDFGGPRTLPHTICEGLWPSPNPPWSFRCLHIGVRSAPVSLMSTSHRPRGGPREHVICEGSRAHPIFAALACVKCVEEARMTSLVGR